jgi:hypothetical protein
MALTDMRTIADALRWALSRIAPENQGDYFDRASQLLAESPRLEPGESLCPRCRGSGEYVGLSCNGPDGYEEIGHCPTCNGVGAIQTTENHMDTTPLDAVIDAYTAETCGVDGFDPKRLQDFIGRYPQHAAALRNYAFVQLTSRPATADEIAEYAAKLKPGRNVLLSDDDTDLAIEHFAESPVPRRIDAEDIASNLGYVHQDEHAEVRDALIQLAKATSAAPLISPDQWKALVRANKAAGLKAQD